MIIIGNTPIVLDPGGNGSGPACADNPEACAWALAFWGVMFGAFLLAILVMYLKEKYGQT